MCYIGTEPWKPKEALQDDGVITDKADIFAFGLTLWEMMTLSVPHLSDVFDDEGMFLYTIHILKLGREEPDEVHQGQGQGPAPGEEQPQAPGQAGADLLESSSVERDWECWGTTG